MLDRIDILNRLLQDHVAARRALAALEAQVDRIAQFHTPDLAAIDRAIGFFTGDMAEMHHPIEDMIFAALAREAPAQAAKLKKIAEEHDEAGALVSQVAEAAGELAADPDRARAAFCRVARGLIAFERHHLRREESGFFTSASEHLTPAAWRGINLTAQSLQKSQEKAAAGDDAYAARRSRRRLVEVRR